jgi:3-oxoacid CoA-transferase B subunit
LLNDPTNVPKVLLDPRVRIAKRLAKELKAGQVVNLGVGIPTMVPDYIDPKQEVYLQSENGILGMGPTPPEEQIDMDLISASKKPITYASGAALFDSVDSFAMIRGGHVDVALLGALEINEQGHIANWAVPGADILGVGGAMDLVSGVKKVVAALTHLNKEGQPKIVRELSCPISGIRPIDVVITEYAVFTVENGKLILSEIAPEIELETLRKITEAQFAVSPELKSMQT